jgi:hypothetical protein
MYRAKHLYTVDSIVFAATVKFLCRAILVAIKLMGVSALQTALKQADQGMHRERPDQQ